MAMGPGVRRDDDKRVTSLPLVGKARDIRRGGLADRRWRAGKTWRWRGLGDAVAGDKNLSRRHVRMVRRFAHGQDRREADVGALHDLAPFVAGLGLEDILQLLLQRRPCLPI